MDLHKVVLILMAQDMNRAVAFYQDVVGLSLILHQGNWAELGGEDAVIALHGGGDGKYRPTGLVFTVVDVGAACEEVIAGGGRVVTPAENRDGAGIILAHMADPEGNGFSLVQSDL